jgi:hypothetical protein
MLSRSRFLIFPFIILLFACGGDSPKTPVETFKTYTRAISKKDTAAMKVLLSDASIKMHEREAKAQNTSVDDILSRETLFNEHQKAVEFKNEKIDGDKASLMVKDSSGAWVILPFVREEGVWKIDKAGYADQMIKDIEDQQNKTFDDLGNFNAEPSVTP